MSKISYIIGSCTEEEMDAILDELIPHMKIENIGRVLVEVLGEDDRAELAAAIDPAGETK